MRLLLALLSVCWSVAPVWAIETDKERDARTACLAGDPSKGVQLLSELFVATKDPNFIFNQGRCFQQNRRYEDAIGRFQEYLRVSKRLSKEDRADAEKHIDDCEALLARQRSQEATAAAAAASQPAVTAEEQTPIAPPIVQENTQPPAESVSGLRIAGIVTVVVGSAAAVAGVLLNMKANSLVTEMKKVDGYTAGKESDHTTYKTLGWVGYGVGAACMVGGVLLYVLGGRPSPSTSTSVVFVPAIDRGQAAVFLRGGF